MTEITAWEYGIELDFEKIPDENALTTIQNINRDLIQWVVLENALPIEKFQGLITQGFVPIVQFDIRKFYTNKQKCFDNLKQLYHVGIRYLQPTGAPNMKVYWDQLWGKQSILERYYDLFIQFSRACVEIGIKVVFPLLQPGGDYWDTVFLRYILSKLANDAEIEIMNSLVLSANGKTFEKPLNWGDGGASRWPKTRPYLTPDGSEDHLGINTFQWYSEIAKEVLQKGLPIFVFHCGEGYSKTLSAKNETDGLEDVIAIFSPKCQDDRNNVKPADVCFFDEDIIPCLNETFSKMIAEENVTKDVKLSESTQIPEHQDEHETKPESQKKQKIEKCIEEYVFIPTYEWGIADWHLEIVLPYLKKKRATFGLSIQEAMHAKRVVLVGVIGVISEIEIQGLRDADCDVIVIEGDGTEIAHQLAMM